MPAWSPLARLTPQLQWVVAVVLAGLYFVAFGAVIVLPVLDWRWFPVLIPAVLLSPALEALFVTPLYTLMGRFRYFSPMLLATKRSDGGLDLHGGTLFDYATQLRWQDRGARAARVVSAGMLRGLLEVGDAAARGALAADAPIVATSWLFGDRSLARLGFTEQPPASHQVLNLYLALVSIALRLSFTRGRLTFPDLRRVRQVGTTAGALQARAGEIRRLLENVERRG